MADVRIFTYSELLTAPVAPSSGRFASDSVGLLKQRYLGRDKVTVNTVTPVSTSALAATQHTKLVHILVDPNTIVHYEIFPEGWSGAITEATAASPFMSGTQLFNFGSGWTISFLEASL